MTQLITLKQKGNEDIFFLSYGYVCLIDFHQCQKYVASRKLKNHAYKYVFSQIYFSNSIIESSNQYVV